MLNSSAADSADIPDRFRPSEICDLSQIESIGLPLNIQATSNVNHLFMRKNVSVATYDRKLFVYKAMSFGEWLRKEIDRRGWSNAELARRVGLSATYISNLSRDFHPSRKAPGGSRPSEDVVSKIANALGTDLDIARNAAGYSPLNGGTHFSIGFDAAVKLGTDVTPDEQQEIAEELALAYEVIMARRKRRLAQNE